MLGCATGADQEGRSSASGNPFSKPPAMYVSLHMQGDNGDRATPAAARATFAWLSSLWGLILVALVVAELKPGGGIVVALSGPRGI